MNEFEGPLDLLLKLIEEERLDITKLSLAHVTEQFLAHMETVEEMRPEHIVDFLLVASELLLIKSHLLLPELKQLEQEEPSDLAERLAQFRTFKFAARAMGARFRAHEKSFAREGEIRAHVFSTIVQPSIDCKRIHELMSACVAKYATKQQLEEGVIESQVTLFEKMQLIRTCMMRAKRVFFSHIASSGKSKVEIIVSFLALLELVKQDVISVTQDCEYGDISLEQISPRTILAN